MLIVVVHQSIAGGGGGGGVTRLVPIGETFDPKILGDFEEMTKIFLSNVDLKYIISSYIGTASNKVSPDKPKKVSIVYIGFLIDKIYQDQ